MRPPEKAKVELNFFRILDVLRIYPNLVHDAPSEPTTVGRTFLPQGEWGRVQKVALRLSIRAATVTLARWMWSILPLMVIGLPRLPAVWHPVMTGRLQHCGRADNVTDHRLNSRTVLMNPISRVIYRNMN